MSNQRTCVDALIERAGKPLSPKRLREVFEAAFDAIWRRARTTLGDVTLLAIVKRVLHNACEQYPAFSQIVVTAAGIDASEIERKLGHLSLEELEPAVRCVLVELLTVIGNLTADILTPALHEAICGIATTQESSPGLVSDEPNARDSQNAV
jgi:hypothetical protein